MHGPHEVRLARAVPDRVANLGQQARQRPVGDERPRPELLVDRVLRERLRPVLEQQLQELERLGLEVHLVAPDEELPGLRIEHTVPEANAHEPPRKASGAASRGQSPTRISSLAMALSKSCGILIERSKTSGAFIGHLAEAGSAGTGLAEQTEAVMRFRWWVAFLTLLFCLIVSTSVSRAGSNTWTGGSPSGAAASFDNPTLVATSGSDPYLVYAAYDSGLYRSADGGRTWALLASFESITALEVSRAMPSTLYLGARARPDTFAGVFKSVDGGVTWNQTLDQTDHVVVNGFATSPKDSSTVLAYTSPNGRTRSVLFTSRDGGDTWEEAGEFTPACESCWGEYTVAVAALILDRKEATTVYAVGSESYFGYGAQYGFFRRSDDDGATWTDRSTGLGFGEVRAIAIDPIDPDTMLIGLTENPTPIFRSFDGGVTWKSSPARLTRRHGGDKPGDGSSRPAHRLRRNHVRRLSDP